MLCIVEEELSRSNNKELIKIKYNLEEHKEANSAYCLLVINRGCL